MHISPCMWAWGHCGMYNLKYVWYKNMLRPLYVSLHIEHPDDTIPLVFV